MLAFFSIKKREAQPSFFYFMESFYLCLCVINLHRAAQRNATNSDWPEDEETCLLSLAMLS